MLLTLAAQQTERGNENPFFVGVGFSGWWFENAFCVDARFSGWWGFAFCVSVGFSGWWFENAFLRRRWMYRVMVLPAEMIRSWQIMFSFPYCSNFNKIKKPLNRVENTYFSHAIMFLIFLAIHFSSALDFPGGGL